MSDAGGRATPGSRVTSVGIDAYRLLVSPRSNAASEGIVQGTGADWFGPLNPMAPVAPVEVAGRALDFPSGYNLEITPRPYEPIKFQDLRNLADNYDIARLCIETRKDQMERLAWNIMPKVMANGETLSTEDDPRIEELTRFFTRPDGEHYWGTWLRMLLEDMLVIGAATVYKRKTRGGQLASLERLRSRQCVVSMGRAERWDVSGRAGRRCIVVDSASRRSRRHWIIGDQP